MFQIAPKLIKAMQCALRHVQLLSYLLNQQEWDLGGAGLEFEPRALNVLSTHYSTGPHTQLTSRNLMLLLLLLLLSLCLSIALIFPFNK